MLHDVPDPVGVLAAMRRLAGDKGVVLVVDERTADAFSAESEPCAEFSPIDFANNLRIVPSAALAGSVAPITSRYFWIAFSPSST